MSELIVETASPGLTVQDCGRFGWRRYGISTAGAMDRLALAVANALVGNGPCVAALETALGGFRLRADQASVLVAASGPGVTLTVGARAVPAGRSALAGPGEAIDVSPVRDGMYGYFAVAGGFAVEAEMASLSSHRLTGLGRPPLSSGDALPLRGAPENKPALELAPSPAHASGAIRIMAGPQDDWFPADAMARLSGTKWEVGARSDRMGLFLTGPDLQPRAASMVSDGVTPGSIQVPPSGQPIVLMRDCQTTGGYPKIATVISADLDRLAQCRVGEAISFELVGRATAVAALAAYRRRIERLHPTHAVRFPGARDLMRENLISGVWGAQASSDERIP